MKAFLIIQRMVHNHLHLNGSLVHYNFHVAFSMRKPKLMHVVSHREKKRINLEAVYKLLPISEKYLKSVLARYFK